MKLIDKVYEDLENRRNRLLSGKVNCIPWGLPRFEEYNPGIEKGTYILLTANSKVGKTQIADFLCVYNAFRQIKENNLPIKLVVKYFSLEMSVEEKITQFLSNLIFYKSGGKYIISPKNLRSTRNAVPREILDFIKLHQDYIDEFLSCVEFIENIRNPYGIFNHMKIYALQNGKQSKKKIIIDGVENIVDDYYEANNPEEYVMCIVDHASLLSPEKGGTIAQAISDLSSRYFIILKNKYKYIPILIQQQASSQESLDNFKHNRTRPTLDGLAENKTTQRDATLILGLYSPFRHEIPEYQGYNIRQFKDNIRFLEILGGRQGGAGTICPLYFNGAVNYFKELPKASDTIEINKTYEIIQKHINNEYK